MLFRRKKDGEVGEVDDSVRSPNYDERADRISALVFHYTGMPSLDAALERLCDGDCENRVSAHYVVSEGGEVYRLVEERLRAWHAGVSCWRGCRDLNDRSVGIEIVNPGHENLGHENLGHENLGYKRLGRGFGYRRFPQRQMEAVLRLSKDIVGRHGIISPWILGHSDIAVGRKLDPGELFDWRYLAKGGVGFFPDKSDKVSSSSSSSSFSSSSLESKDGGDVEVRLGILLGMMGYDCSVEMGLCVEAFQRRWRASRVDGVADRECVGVAEAVLRGWGEL